MSDKLKIWAKNIALGISLILVAAGLIITAVIIGTNMLRDKIYTISIHDGEELTEIRTTNLSVENALKIAEIELGEYDAMNVDEKASLNSKNTDIYISRAKKVTLQIGEEETTVYTLKDSVEEVLLENNVQIGTYDYVNTIIENPLNQNENNIIYKSAIPVTITLNGVSSVVYTTKSTIKEVLEENNIEVNDDDFVNQKATDTIDLSNTQISIQTAHNVTLIYDGVTKNVSTQEKNVEGLLKQYAVKLSGLDKLANGVTVNTKIKENLVVSVIRVRETTVTETITLAYKTVTQNTDELLKGFRKTVSGGVNGKQVDTYTVVTENGKQVSKTKTKSEVVKKPVNAVTKVGTKTYTTFSSSFKLNHGYKKVIDVSAVSYNLEGLNNRLPSDPKYGLTANGSKVRAGIIAVDKRVIPVGTKVYVEIVGGNDYGYAIAADVGVSGYTIDIYLNSESECINFGRRKAKVYILSNQSVNVYSLRGG